MEKVRQRVALTDLRFFAYHGFYPEEQLLGNEFTVALHVGFTKTGEQQDVLTNTVNYEVLYSIVKDEMQQPRKLLETVVEAILNRVLQEFPFICDAEVAITKLRPPFGGDHAKAQVALFWQREN
ncbi:dihydroneopterin aldolase [Parapedobacter composti]|uniref:7,8-dihydroneopterin aldolase n=1 Tax=Parapedobacter composti TaxID=623281 RepID=A0A1I1GDD4_9SPHI|nr:dihydroneopterin aldolase [Parapedobacter composti]SFC09292.1 dihydroneopterin aldolase [Parapedobacter composti]